MKLGILLYMFLISCGFYSQVIPYGVYITIEGKVKFSEMESNQRGYIEDTVYLNCGEWNSSDDIANIPINYLTLVDFPDDSWTNESYGDPSKINDTTPRVYSDNYLWQNTPFNVITIDTLFIVETPNGKSNRRKKEEIHQFQNIYRGDKLNDSVISLVNQKLTHFKNNYQDKTIFYDARGKLYMDLSHYDTVIEKQAIYDFLVDHFVDYKYNKKGLTNAIGYHWNLGVESDSLVYDKKHRLIYFSRESIGSSKTEIHFTYNKSGQVISNKLLRSYSGNQEGEPLIVSSTVMNLYTYHKSGLMSSITFYYEDGIQNTCKFSYPD